MVCKTHLLGALLSRKAENASETVFQTPIPEHANAAIGTDRGAVTIDVIVFRLQNDVLFTALHPFDKEKKPEKPVYQDENWPTREECDSFGVRPLEWNEYPTTFLPPENKGFE